MDLSFAARSCPVCGSADDSVLYAESNADLGRLDSFAFASRKVPEYMHWRLLECRRCDLVYASPAPTSQALSAVYDEAAFDSGREARHAARTYAGLLPNLTRRLPDLNGALDIGTGDGVFLEELLGAGFRNVEGVEPSSAPINASLPQIRPLIRHDVFRATDFRRDSLSIVTCFQTIEHLADPLAMSREIYSLLKPGGAALFVAHNRRAMSARILGRRSPIFDIEHLQLFSPFSLRQLMTTAGFIDVRLGSVLNRYPMGYWARLLPIPRRLKAPLIRVMDMSPIGRVAVPLPAGNLYVAAFKPASS